MSYEDIVAMLEELSLPVAYDHFAEGEGPDPPFICYLNPENDPFAADDTVYYQFQKIDIEVYTDAKDPALERKVEKMLNRHELVFFKTETWIEKEKLFLVLYSVDVSMDEYDESEEDDDGT